MKRRSKSLLSYWSAKKVCDSMEVSNEDLDSGEMDHEGLTDADKDTSKDTDSETDYSESEGEPQYTSEQSSSG